MSGEIVAAIILSAGTLAATLAGALLAHGARKAARGAHDEVQGNGTGVPLSKSQQEQIAMLQEILDITAETKTSLASHVEDANLHHGQK